jgi:Tfp pilus assembly protein PilO
MGTAFMFIAALAVYMLMVAPEYERVNVMRGELAARAAVFAEKSSIISRVRDLVAQYQGTARIQDTISLTLPREENSAAITQQLSGIAGATGIIIQSMSLQSQALLPSANGDSEAVKAVGTSEINLRLLGTYEAVKTFIASVETNIRLMDVVSFRAEVPSRASAGPLNYNLVINTYYQPE